MIYPENFVKMRIERFYIDSRLSEGDQKTAVDQTGRPERPGSPKRSESKAKKKMREQLGRTDSKTIRN